ncbi:iditol 2-dehydrogenase [Halarchaeum grantii]|uniref:Iditol 2-dehydrogenase n=1 Tax=Halarchaeum grantii TaxID=1193105 RepID=A0A830F657_9EURY|nr:iditol 2-dehydrogenase [Halarchaeum grantii]
MVDVAACGVCKTDYHMYHGAFDIDYPQVLGHEAAGTVTAVGEDVRRVEVGDRVALNPTVPCGDCSYCKAGRETLCEDLTSIGGAADTVLDGAFAEKVRAPAGNVERIGDLDFETAALAEPLACCVHGVERAALDHGDSVVVIGAGPIGLLLTQTLRDAGAGEILVSEPVAERRTLALELGADYVNDPTETAVTDAASETLGAVDLAVEVVGFEATVQQAIDLTSPGGRTLVFGVPPEDATVEVRPFDYFYDEVELTGTYSLRPADFEVAVGLLRQGRVDVDPLVTDELPLADLPTAFERIDNSVGMKKIVHPGE